MLVVKYTKYKVGPDEYIIWSNNNYLLGSGSDCKNLNCTSISPTHTASQQQNTSTTAGNAVFNIQFHVFFNYFTNMEFSSY